MSRPKARGPRPPGRGSERSPPERGGRRPAAAAPARQDRPSHERRQRPEAGAGAREGSTRRPAPSAAPASGPLPSAGEHVWTCREGFERDLVDDLAASGPELRPRIVAPSLVASRGAPPRRDGAAGLTFARQGFAVQALVRAEGSTELVARVTVALREAVLAASARAVPWALHVWVPDSERANPLSASVETLARAVELRAAAVDAAWADRRTTAAAAHAAGGVLAQVCVPERGAALVGATPTAQAPSLHPGGRARMRVSSEAPSRAAMKLEEALDWIGHGPAAGETCVDLGAAPGGWTFVVMARGARVIAVDPGAMAPELMRRKGLTHIRGSAFDFEPPGPVDWLLCDMVWRPLEVAALLARWARRRWARFVVANIKLPMRGKVEFLARVREILAEGGWQQVRLRHLYHDREEITLAAHRM